MVLKDGKFRISWLCDHCCLYAFCYWYGDILFQEGLEKFRELFPRRQVSPVVDDCHLDGRYELRYESKPAAFLRGFRAFFAGIVQNLLTIGWVTFAMSSIITTVTDIPRWWAIYNNWCYGRNHALLRHLPRYRIFNTDEIWQGRNLLPGGCHQTNDTLIPNLLAERMKRADNSLKLPALWMFCFFLRWPTVPEPRFVLRLMPRRKCERRRSGRRRMCLYREFCWCRNINRHSQISTGKGL